MAVKYFSAEISCRQVTMYNDHYALVQQYNRPEPLQSNIAREQRRMRMMDELSYRGVKLVQHHRRGCNSETRPRVELSTYQTTS